MSLTLSILEDYCQKWSLKVNPSKSKIMLTHPMETTHPFVVDGNILEVVDCFQYLGFFLSCSGKLALGINDLASRGKRAYFAFLSKVRKIGSISVPDLCYIFSALVEPVMLYGSELWGTLVVDAMEKLLLKFCKYALYVPTTCSNMAVLGELGRCPFHMSSAVRAVKFFKRCQARNVPALIKDALILSKGCGKNSFYGRVMSLLSQYNILWSSQESVNIDALAINLFTDFIGNWNTTIDSSNKLLFYALVKGSFCMEPYLWILKEKKKRNVLSRFRMSCHHLPIESGRHTRPIISHDDRLCTSCGVLGDERHYLLYCKQLMDVRINLFGEAALSDIWMKYSTLQTNCY